MRYTNRQMRALYLGKVFIYREIRAGYLKHKSKIYLVCERSERSYSKRLYRDNLQNKQEYVLALFNPVRRSKMLSLLALIEPTV